MRLVLATRNLHKVEELQALLGPGNVEIVPASAFPDVPDVVEDGDTFEANAIKKAVTLARATGLPALADDSGLEVDALKGAPGVRSARYAGEPVSHDANNRKLLEALRDEKNRTARFRCVLALAEPSGEVRTVEGVCEGHIAGACRGTGGFGYDPLFIPDGYRETFAELSPMEKNLLSHRGRAVAAARQAFRL